MNGKKAKALRRAARGWCDTTGTRVVDGQVVRIGRRSAEQALKDGYRRGEIDVDSDGDVSYPDHPQETNDESI